MFKSSIATTVFYLCCLFVLVNAQNNDYSNDLAYRRAKRAFMQKAKEYIKQNPISPELQAFIDRFKRGHTPSLRTKRNDDQMYVMQEGNLIPFDPKRSKRQNISDFVTPQMYKVNDDGEVVPVRSMIGGELTTSDMQNLTVVPLIIPINLEASVSIVDRESIDIQSTTELMPRQRLLISRERGTKPPQAAENDTKSTSTSKDDDSSDFSMIGLSATDKANQVSMLNKVLSDVEDLINRENGGRDYSSEGMACDLSGDWDSSAGGVLIRIIKNDTCEVPASVASVPVCITEKDPPGDGFLRPANWNASGVIPFKRASIVVITATSLKGKKVASFIGECKICDGTEAIVGNWMLARVSSDCRDQKAARSLHQDVLRKSTVSHLRNEHLKLISSTSRTSTNLV